MTARSLSQAPSTMEETPARGIILGMLLGAAFWIGAALVVGWLA